MSIERDLRAKIEEGALRVGDRLPQEYELAKDYHTSRRTLRKALALLSSDGYLYRVPGKGTFVVSPDDKDLKVIRKTQNHLRKMNRGIAVLVPSVSTSIGAGVIRGVEDTCREHGYHVVLGNYDAEPEKEREYMEVFVGRGISAFVILPSYNSHLNSYYEVLKKREIPFVLVGVGIRGIEADLVQTDNIGAAYHGTRQLISSGCRNIAFFCSRFQSVALNERLMGYMKALRDRGIAVRDELIREGDKAGKFSKDELQKLLSERGIDGIFSANESTTIAIMNILNEQSFQRERPVRIIAFDRPEFLECMNQPVTFVIQPSHEIGKVGTELLLQGIKEKRGEKKSKFKMIFLQAEMEAVGGSRAKKPELLDVG